MLAYLPRSLTLLVFSFFVQNIYADTMNNVTIDDSDHSKITYSGSWGDTAASPLDYGGKHSLSSDPSATATFTFTGVAIYMLSPKWPYNVNTAVSLDGGPKQSIDLVDKTQPTANGGPETANYSVVWSQSGLQNGSHTVVLSRVPGGDFVVCDGFIYTQQIPEQKSKSSHVVPIAVGAACGALVLLLGGLAIWLWQRRKNQKNNLQNSVPPNWAAAPFTQNTANSAAPLSYNAAPPAQEFGQRTSAYSKDGSQPTMSMYNPYEQQQHLQPGMLGATTHPMGQDPRYSHYAPSSVSSHPQTALSSPHQQTFGDSHHGYQPSTAGSSSSTGGPSSVVKSQSEKQALINQSKNEEELVPPPPAYSPSGSS